MLVLWVMRGALVKGYILSTSYSYVGAEYTLAG